MRLFDGQMTSASQWCTMQGPVSLDLFRSLLFELAEERDLELQMAGNTSAKLYPHGAEIDDAVTVTWRAHQPMPSNLQRHVIGATFHTEVLFSMARSKDEIWVIELLDELAQCLSSFSMEEVAELRKSMPLLMRCASSLVSAFDGWALIFRDHFVEHSLGILLAFVRAGIPAEWIIAFAKGDQTCNRHRIDATLKAQGIRTGVFDNNVIDELTSRGESWRTVRSTLDTFIDSARSAGRKILIIDDGGLITCGYASPQSGRRVDAAIELTMSGLKRIRAAGELCIPVFNLAQSDLKQTLGYPEIADSCLRRIQTILPGYKIRGRTVIVLGFGSLGSKLAVALNANGAQVHIVDTDILRLIEAAEAGFCTYRSLSVALSATSPFLIVGTTGEVAIMPADLLALPDGVFLAPFATKDFSIIPTMAEMFKIATIAGVGKHYRLSATNSFTVLGDGRSLNLFEADSIPNEGYDAYRTGTLLAASKLCRRVDRLDSGVHLDLVNQIIRESGILETYYEMYFGNTKDTVENDAKDIKVGARCMHVVVIGYGVAGRLHASIFAEYGAQVSIVDPKYQGLPDIHQVPSIEDLPRSTAKGVTMWTICSPTQEHVNSLRKILELDHRAKVLLEKPACQAHEISEFRALVASNPEARVVIVDQYRHASMVRTAVEALQTYEPDAHINTIEITFNKDRRLEIDRGRFIDRSYGVLGYEWLHMLSILNQILGNAFEDYIRLPLSASELFPSYHPDLFLSGLRERTALSKDDHRIGIYLKSNITEPVSDMVLGHAPEPTNREQWSKNLRPIDDKVRRVAIVANNTRAHLYLDPITAKGGWQLPRNKHRLLVEHRNCIVLDEVLSSSPMHNAIRKAVFDLLNPERETDLDLRCLQRIATAAECLRQQSSIGVQSANEAS